jgi:hypothetical protein
MDNMSKILSTLLALFVLSSCGEKDDAHQSTLLAVNTQIAYYHSKHSNFQTGIFLEEGKTYTIVAEEITPWFDLTVCAGVDGWKQHPKLASWLGQFAKEKYLPFYHLTGCISDLCFTISRGIRDLQVPETGELIVFVNDVPYFFWNNSGIAKITVSEPNID